MRTHYLICRVNDHGAFDRETLSSLIDAEAACSARAAADVGTVWQVFAPIASFTAAAPVVTRAQVELPKPAEPVPDEIAFEQRRWKAPAAKVDADGWIPWDGGECPVTPDTRVEFRMRAYPAVNGVSAAGDLWWGSRGLSGDIIAYRIGERS